MSRSIQTCPREWVFTYAQARAIYDRIKPIRGRKVATNHNSPAPAKASHPLGARHLVDQYSVRLNEIDGQEVVQFVLYRTPVITYYQNHTIVVDTEGFHSHSTHEFIDRFLGTRSCARMRKTHVTLGDVSYLIEGDKFNLRYEQGAEGTGKVVFDMPAPAVYGYKINRERANNVMKDFKEFSTYFNAFISLRKHEREVGFYHRRMVLGVGVNVDEVTSVLGCSSTGDEAFQTATSEWTWLCETPDERGYFHRNRSSSWDEYIKVLSKFIELIKSDQPEETKHANFYKAAIALTTRASHFNPNENEVFVPVQFIKNSVKDSLYRYYASNILDKKRLADGVVPNNRYAKWIPKVTR